MREGNGRRNRGGERGREEARDRRRRSGIKGKGERQREREVSELQIGRGRNTSRELQCRTQISAELFFCITFHPWRKFGLGVGRHYSVAAELLVR